MIHALKHLASRGKDAVAMCGRSASDLPSDDVVAVDRASSDCPDCVAARDGCGGSNHVLDRKRPYRCVCGERTIDGKEQERAAAEKS